MSLFGSLMGDFEDDPIFGSHMRHMRQMNNMMNSLFSDPFGMLDGGGPLSITGPRHSSSLMPFMPQMPSLNRVFTADLINNMRNMGGMGSGSSYSSSTVVMSSGPHGKPQVISSTSSTKIGPNGIKETRKTLQDTRTGTKSMSIGHHIGERAHVIEREQNVYTGDAEERQEYINLDEDEAEEFDREFQQKAGGYVRRGRAPPAILPSPPAPLALMPAPPTNESVRTTPRPRPTSRRPLRTSVNALTMPASGGAASGTGASVREVYAGAHPQPQRHRQRLHKSRHAPPADH